MATDEISGARYPLETDSGDPALWLKRAVNDISSQVVPRFASTGARDTAYAAAITAGTIASIANGSQCTANGVKYRRVGGNWREDRQRIITRTITPTGGSAANLITSGGAAETGITAGAAALTSFTLYEACSVLVRADFRVNPASAAQCVAKIDGTQVGIVPGIMRADVSAATGGVVALSAGSHTIALRVDAIGGTATWTNAQVAVSEFIVE